ncbi:hypothetical protein NDU88_000616 [Pleurodeles waltl]|uniref:Receptor ligand binding region domain-containing protein n=1 Tax=Pleurodeles waltl TaxID=8319 RepID=A0AAV7KPW1_PLEWA|nr:hypothetical protein NDU88_000616 [Pleurodeles waltl]
MWAVGGSFSVSGVASAEQLAGIPSPGRSGFSRRGDIMIGGIFPVHVDAAKAETLFTARPVATTCQTFVYQHFLWLQAMVFATEEINRNPNVLPNITLGFHIYDSCVMLRRSLEGALWILSGKEELVVNYRCQRKPLLAGIVGEASSTHSIVLARLFGLYRYPQVSYFSSSPVLSDRSQFPSFFRTIPNDEFQSRGLAQLVIYFGWSWVGLLAEDSDYGQHGIQIMKEQLIQAGACIAFSENILTGQLKKNAVHLATLIKMSSANAIAIFSLDEYLLPVLDELIWLNVTGKMWIASEAWSTSTILSMDKYSMILKGTIGFAIHSGEIQGFKEYLQGGNPSRSPGDLLSGTFWEEAFICTWLDLNTFENKSKSCTGLKLRDGLNNVSHYLTDWRVSYNVYTAVYAIAWALRDLFLCRAQKGPFLNGSLLQCAVRAAPLDFEKLLKKDNLPAAFSVSSVLRVRFLTIRVSASEEDKLVSFFHPKFDLI